MSETENKTVIKITMDDAATLVTFLKRKKMKFFCKELTYYYKWIIKNYFFEINKLVDHSLEVASAWDKQFTTSVQTQNELYHIFSNFEKIWNYHKKYKYIFDNIHYKIFIWASIMFLTPDFIESVTMGKKMINNKKHSDVDFLFTKK